MHRALLLELLARHVDRHPAEREVVARFTELARAHADCFDRHCLPGHVTGSAWILSPDREHVLLGHHRKLDRWLQLGGHADGDPDPLRVALREAREESGLVHFDLLALDGAALEALDLDVHPIPARRDEPAHLHFDVRFCLVARAREGLRKSDESHALRWVPRDELARFAGEESLARMERKTRVLERAGAVLRPISR